ncbi:MAG: hypothetical protein IJ092_10920 [Atopobiaceae bacterium]|nr:hypothetical protein [Atopobiaceae bacterium]MBR1828004.1 hypothetical protein [Atopobiaceae bacterium]
MSEKKTVADRVDEIGETVTEGFKAVEDGVSSAFKKVEEAKDRVKANAAAHVKGGKSAGNGGGGAF